MNKIYAFLIIVCFPFTVFCQKQALNYRATNATQFYTSKSNKIKGIFKLETDPNHQPVLMMDFWDTILINQEVFVNHSSVSTVLVRMNKNLEILHTIGLLDLSRNLINSDFKHDGNGNYYLAGSYIGELKINDTIKLDSFDYYRSTFIIKFDSLLRPMYAKSFRGEGTMKISFDNNFNPFVLKKSGSTGALFKLDRNGNIVWTKNIPYLEACLPTFNGVYLFGHIDSFIKKITIDTAVITLFRSDKADIFIVKLDCDGNFKWYKKLDAVSKWYNEIKNTSLCTDDAGNLYFANEFSDTFSCNGKDFISEKLLKVFIAKIDSNGRILWIKTTDNNQGPESSGAMFFNNNELILNIQGTFEFLIDSITIDGLPATYAPITILLDTAGHATDAFMRISKWDFTIPAEGKKFYHLTRLYAGDIYWADGIKYETIGFRDYILLTSDTFTPMSIAEQNIPANEFSVFPNPSADKITIKSERFKANSTYDYSIFDLYGRLTNTGFIYLTNGHAEIDISKLPPSLYFLNLIRNQDQIKLKFLKY